MSLGEVSLLVGIIVGSLAILGTLLKGIGWLASQARNRKQKKAPPPYPVTLVCEDAAEFHPSAGFREGFRIEVYNASENPVQVKGFGLRLGMQAQGSWERLESVIDHPLSSFPRWLRPRESFEGYLDTELLADKIYGDRESSYWESTHAYVDVSGHGRLYVDPQTGQVVDLSTEG